MQRFFFLIIFFFVSGTAVLAQVVTDTNPPPVPDTIRTPDTTVRRTETISRPRIDPPATDTVITEVPADTIRTQNYDISPRPRYELNWNFDYTVPFSVMRLTQQILGHHPYFGFTAEIYDAKSDIKQFAGKELIFYALIALLLVFALLRNAFPKYFFDLFRLFFRTTLKQRQIREQLIQTPLPSLLLNGFFVISAGMYLSFVLRYFDLNPIDNIWLMSLYCAIGLSICYFVKFLGLKICGWLFNMREAADSYIFIVFIVNKMAGIILLPFLVLLAFTKGAVFTSVMTLSWCAIGGLLIYRFILTYAAIRNQVRVNPFHFFLYLCAFEIAPLLLVYKALLLFLRITT